MMQLRRSNVRLSNSSKYGMPPGGRAV
jgi:hypothetical protein